MSNTVVERLLESWLDSQTERRYQPAFIQLLVSHGWTVLHNTRHSPIELGKDVIARDPDGKLFCFQLKGNPRSRVTKNEAQALLPQVIELIELPPPLSFRRTGFEKHVAVFVTNGEVDEEARLVLDAAGERAGGPGAAAEKFEIWTRGRFLRMLSEKAGAVWPSTPDGIQRILELISADGRETPQPVLIIEALSAAVPRPTTTSSASAKNAALGSLFLLAELIKGAWYRTDNHYALQLITVTVSIYSLLFADSSERRVAVEQFATLALEHCSDLLIEAQARGFDPDIVWAEAEPLSEFDVQWERRRLVADCAATLVLAGDKSPNFDEVYAANLLNSTCTGPKMYGLYGFPGLIVRTWARQRLNASQTVEQDLARHLSQVIAINLERSSGRPPLASPYYSFEDVWADMLGLPFFTENVIGQDSFRRRAWFMRATLYMLAKRNLKQTCGALWSDFTKLLHEEPDLPPHTFFSPVLTDEGRVVTITYHHMTWLELVNQAVSAGNLDFLQPHHAFDWLIATYVVLVPYRASTPVLLWLDTQLNQTWYHSNYLPS